MRDRCEVCGAKEETHEEDHLCRLHEDFRGICTVCRKPFQNCRIKGGLCTGNIEGGCSIDCIANDYF